MSCFFNQCQCECQKQIIRTQLIVIMKQKSKQKKRFKKIQQKNNPASTVALEPKYMSVKTHNLFKLKNKTNLQSHNSHSLTQNQYIFQPCSPDNKNHQQCFSKIKPQQQTLIKNVYESKCRLNCSNMQEQNIFTISNDIKYKVDNNNNILKQKAVNCFQQQQTQRKTIKRNTIRQQQSILNYNNIDKVPTTKRQRKRNSFQMKKSLNEQLVVLESIKQAQINQTKRKANKSHFNNNSISQKYNQKANISKTQKENIKPKKQPIHSFKKDSLNSSLYHIPSERLSFTSLYNIPQQHRDKQNKMINNQDQQDQNLQKQLKEQIQNLKSVLLKLKSEEQTLELQKYAKQVEFLSQYEQNEKRKTQLQKSSDQRYQQLRQLRQLINSCKLNRFA